jgi:hypothetical protein
MAIHFDVITLMGNYIVVNELKSLITILNKFLMYMLKRKIEIHTKMIMIWTYENMVHFRTFKSPFFFWLNFF